MEEDKNRVSVNTMEISIAEASSMFPGFRFSPTDEELICFYLRQKIDGFDSCVEVIPEVDICIYEPWDLPAKSIIQSDNEWFFFSPRGRKYPNGSQSKRATNSGYWKATGKERNVKSGSGSTVIGTKRTLVFHTGRAPRGQRTEWIMHEYCMTGKSQDLMVVCRLRRNGDFSLDDTSRKRLHSSDMNNATASSSGIEQTGRGDGANVAGGQSKECSSSNNSHSVEQNECELECNGKIAEKEHSSTEEDCFADIMRDEIVKLDDTSIYLGMSQPADAESKRKSKQAGSSSGQGTANRRLRLRRLRSRPSTGYRVRPTSSGMRLRGFKLLVWLCVLASLLILLASVLMLLHFQDFLCPRLPRRLGMLL